MNGQEGRDCGQEEAKALGTRVLNSAQPFVPKTSLESELKQLSLTPTSHLLSHSLQSWFCSHIPFRHSQRSQMNFRANSNRCFAVIGPLISLLRKRMSTS